MKKWEYKFISHGSVPQRGGLFSTVDDARVYLEEQGDDGWELAGIDYGCFIFKR